MILCVNLSTFNGMSQDHGVGCWIRLLREVFGLVAGATDLLCLSPPVEWPKIDVMNFDWSQKRGADNITPIVCGTYEFIMIRSGDRLLVNDTLPSCANLMMAALYAGCSAVMSL